MSEGSATRENEGVLVGRFARRKTATGPGRAISSTDQQVKQGGDSDRLALALAVGHWLGRAIERGEFKDQATAARRYGLSRARVTQLIDLTLLSTAIQEEILAERKDPAVVAVAEREVRQVVRVAAWWAQHRAWRRSQWRSVRQRTATRAGLQSAR